MPRTNVSVPFRNDARIGATVRSIARGDTIFGEPRVHVDPHEARYPPGQQARGVQDDVATHGMTYQHDWTLDGRFDDLRNVAAEGLDRPARPVVARRAVPGQIERDDLAIGGEHRYDVPPDAAVA